MITGGILIVAFGAMAVYVVICIASHLAAPGSTMRQRNVELAAVRPGDVVATSGTVAPSEQGLVRSPASGREVVMYYIDVLDTAGDTTDIVHTTKDNREFFLRDAWGRQIRILPKGSTMTVTCTTYGTKQSDEHIDVNGVPRREDLIGPELLAWANSVAGLHDRTGLAVEESLIAAGDRLHVFGYADQAPDGTVQLRAHPEPHRALFLSTFDKSGLTALHRRRLLGLALALVFALTFVAGGVVLVLLEL